jgi:glycosyltransferase involved in cell wall biosynthesis
MMLKTLKTNLRKNNGCLMTKLVLILMISAFGNLLLLAKKSHYTFKRKISSHDVSQHSVLLLDQAADEYAFQPNPLVRRHQKLESTDFQLCESKVNWSTLPIDPNLKQAAMYTPYNIVVGGGERYLLSTVASMQRQGYHVTILTNNQNVCQSSSEAVNVAQDLHLSLDMSMLQFRIVATVDGMLPTQEYNRYSLFFLLGNEKLPQIPGIGFVNFYMNQFPFDLDRTPTGREVYNLSTYDYVLLNSEYSYKWYMAYAESAIWLAQTYFKLAPQVTVLHPPVYRSDYKFSEELEKNQKKKRNGIVLLGRFFSGRQSKGHIAAIHLFQQIRSSLPEDTVLHFVGNLMPGHVEYLEELKELAADLPVQFHVSATPQVLKEVMTSSLVQWHMTGAETNTTADPASEEHFGISIAEGMGFGTIPVLLDRGGVSDIVQHGLNGFLGATVDDVGQLTIEVFHASSDALQQLHSNALKTPLLFDDEIFWEKFSFLAHRGKLTKPFRHLIKETSDTVLNRSFHLPSKARYAAVIIELRHHYAFEYVVKNVMHHLGSEWSLYVFHGTLNEDYVKSSLDSISGVEYRNLGAIALSIPALNRLLKSVSFWSNIEADKVLFFQTDSLLVHGRIEPFLKYNYIGAPWHQQNERWILYQDVMQEGVGNGGLSLRSTSLMKDLAIEVSSMASNKTAQEDFIYSYIMESKGSERMGLAPRKEAYKFAVEVPCADLKEVTPSKGSEHSGHILNIMDDVPLGLHATWYYMNYENESDRNDLLSLLELSVC